MKTLKNIIKILVIFLIWTVFIIYGTVNGFFVKPITNDNSSESFINAVKTKSKDHFIGNIAMALIENGTISKEYFYSIKKEVDRNTIFQIASVSKWVTSWGVLSLVDEGKLDLDAPISKYLTRWTLPQSKFNNNEVTLRKILSHTAGFTDELGYSGFTDISKVQTIESSLTKATDAMKGVSGITEVGYKPGSKYVYSGGGYLVLQLVIEEVSGLSFEDYMQKAVFKPLKMYNSTFIWKDSLKHNTATFYDIDSTKVAHLHFTASGAASLYTNLSDLEVFLKSNLNRNKNAVLKKETLDIMHKAEAYTYGLKIHGLGPMIFKESENGDHIIGHDGGNFPAISTTARINISTGDGIILLETGYPNFAARMGSEWVYWKTGHIDPVMIWNQKSTILKFLITGYLIITIIFVYPFKKNTNLIQ